MNQTRLKELLFDLRQIINQIEAEVYVNNGLLTDEDYKNLNESLRQSNLRGPVNPPYPNNFNPGDVN